MTIADEKTAVRAECLGRRAVVTPETRRRFGQSLAEMGSSLVRGISASHTPVVSAYHPMRDEADTLPLLAALSALGIRTALPVTGARERPLRFLAWRPGEALRRGRYGVMEPLGEGPDLVPDVLFVPLAAFDDRGFRVGYGAGYYDATLADLRSRKPVFAAGVAFSVQGVARVPAEPHDQRLDAVVTEHGLRRFEER